MIGASTHEIGFFSAAYIVRHTGVDTGLLYRSQATSSQGQPVDLYDSILE